MWFKKIFNSSFFIRLGSWEYWPFLIIYWPVFIYWIWFSIKARSILYFTASNPGIANGGMLGESKYDILKGLPQDITPATLFIRKEESSDDLIKKTTDISYPIICKPDVGERGRLVEKIKSVSQLLQYHKDCNEDYLIQEYLSEEYEFGVFYYRYPSQDKGTISSVVQKEMLSVTGDGKSTLRALILSYNRAKLQWPRLQKKYKTDLDTVIAKNIKVGLVAIGNHSRGTKFLNANHLINDKLIDIFDKISKKIDGFYFGRFDIKAASIEDLYQGKVKIMELNGAGSEPAHIYDPTYSLLKAYQVILSHWRILYEISMENNAKGISFMTFKDGWQEYKKSRALTV